ncbi:MAG: class I SAM-dependent methyltransferase [Trueperaceae bacterium]
MRLAVTVEDGADEQSAAALAERLGLEMLADIPPPDMLLLVRTSERLELRESGPAAGGTLAVEFLPGRGSPQLRRAAMPGGRAAATGAPPRLIDATAGLAQDAFALAEWGCRVDLIERSPVVAALLADGLERARRDGRTGDAASRMHLHQGEALDILPRLKPAGVVYLDPMYPRSGREGRKGKGMRLLRELLGDDRDAHTLLEAARRAAGRRVVVKRPLRAPALAGHKPSGSLTGTTVRYDLYGPLRD